MICWINSNDFFYFKDVIGIVDTCSSIIPFINRTSNKDSVRREVTLMDEDTSMSITLWDEQVTLFALVFHKNINFN